jgi:cell division protein FtsB
MRVVQEIRKRARLIAGPVLGISLMCYFAYHLVEGERGLISWLRLSQEVKLAKTRLAQLDGEREALDRRVSLMRPEHLDRDMLDERVRATLNLVAPHDIVILDTGKPR